MSKVHPYAKYVLAVLLAGLLISLFYHTGYFASDDLGYTEGTYALMDSGNLNTTFGANRLTMVLMNIALLTLWGGSWFMTILTYNLFHPAVALLVFAIGNRIAGPRAGLLGAVFYIFMPLSFLYTGAILPDVPMTFFALASIYLMLLAIDPQRGRAAVFALAAVAALSMYLAIAAKEYAVIICPAIALMLVMHGDRQSMARIVWTTALYAALIIAILLAESAVVYARTGEVFFRLIPVGQKDVVDALLTSQERYGTNPLERLANFHARFVYVHGHLAYVIYALYLSLPVLNHWLDAGDPRRRRRVLGLWLVSASAFLYLLFGSASLTRYFPASIVARYYILPLALVAPIILWPAYLLARRVLSQSRAVLVVGSLMAVLGAVQVITHHNQAGRGYHADSAQAFMRSYGWAKTVTDGLPVLPSAYYGRRMFPLFPRGFDEWIANVNLNSVSLDKMIRERLPFVYITLGEETRISDLDRRNRAEIEAQGYELVKLRMPDFRPLARVWELEQLLNASFWYRPQSQGNRQGYRPLVYLACPEPGCARDVLVDQPETDQWLHGERSYGKRVIVAEGHDRPRMIFYWLEDGSYKAKPAHPQSRLQTPTNKVTGQITVDSTLEGSAIVRLFAYDADGNFLTSTRSPEIRLEDGRKTLRLKLESETPIAALRSATVVTPEGMEPGTVEITLDAIE